jgi:hypothetical protein
MQMPGCCGLIKRGRLMDILSLFQQQSRRIGLIVPSVVISEKHNDTLEITEHPVEVGAQFLTMPTDARQKWYAGRFCWWRFVA